MIYFKEDHLLLSFYQETIMKNNFLLEITVFLWKFRVIKNEGHVWFNLMETKYMLWYNNATMNKRNYQILKYLKETEEYVTSETLSAMNNVSTKTILKDIKSLNCDMKATDNYI